MTKRKEEETQDAPQTPEASNTEPETPNSTPAQDQDELTVIRTALDEAQAALTEKDDRISELAAGLAQAQEAAGKLEPLQSEFEVLKADFESSQQDRAALTDAATQATQKYLEAVRIVNPDIPANLITGSTVAEIDESVQKGKEITDHVRAALVAESKNARVPAGAPTRAVNLEGLTADQLIRLGIEEQIGGTEQ